MFILKIIGIVPTTETDDSEELEDLMLLLPHAQGCSWSTMSMFSSSSSDQVTETEPPYKFYKMRI